MTVEAVVADHYSSGTLLSRITDALGKIGKDRPRSRRAT